MPSSQTSARLERKEMYIHGVLLFFFQAYRVEVSWCLTIKIRVK